MPIYEYRCRECSKKSTFITLSVKIPVDPVCAHCGSKDMVKLVSRVAFKLSEETRLERLADPARLAGLDEDDPKSMARWMKNMGRELGEDLGEDFEQAVDEAIEGEAGGEDDD